MSSQSNKNFSYLLAMKLDQKYFGPFMAVMALITMIFIVISTFNYKDKQEENFRKFTAEYVPLLSEPHVLVTESDSVSFDSFAGQKVIILFWASWSEKSAEMMKELDSFSAKDGYEVIGATVKDAEETAALVLPKHDFVFIDGAKLFNDLKVPGIPSYVLLDEEGNIIDVSVGYREGVADRILSAFEE